MLLKVGNKNLTIRKWKGKDKKAFVKSIKSEVIDENEVLQSLVYSCIEEPTVLSVDEFKYVLSRIRAISLNEDITIEFYCEECSNLHKQTFQLKDIVRYTFEDVKKIKVGKNEIKLGDVKNKEVYIKRIAEDSIFDLLLRVESFNGDDAFTLDTLIEKFDDLDIDELSEIIEKFENSKFKVDDVNEVICPHCEHKTLYKFDELPEFLPKDWLE